MKNLNRITLMNFIISGKQWLSVICIAVGLAQPAAHAQNTYPRTSGGYMGIRDVAPPQNYNAGYSFYSTAWPMLGDYPKDNYVQSGLYGTWMAPSRSIVDDHYTTIEGGMGWWTDRSFQTATPKFLMGGVTWGTGAWWYANSPGSGSLGGNGKYGIAQLSPSLLFPLDGLNLRQGTSGKLLGYGYLALPLTEAKTTTAGAAVPTGNHCWTLFMNAGNYKGPTAFFTPYYWSQMSLLKPQLAGQGFDSRWATADKGFAMESQETVPAAACDTADNTFIRSMPVYYPVDSNGYSLLMHRLSVYDQSALWNDVGQWLAASGVAPPGVIKPESTYVQAANAAFPLWTLKNGDIPVGPLNWTGIVDTYALNSKELGYQWKTDQLTVLPSANGSLIKLPEYYQGPTNASATSQWIPISAEDLPSSPRAALANVTFTKPNLHNSVVAVDSDPAWTSPGPSSGPSSGPFRALLGDGSFVTYYWYRFADQPALQKADMTLAERNRLQIVVEKMHREWKNDRDYIAPPTSGTLAELDVGQLVTPPLGFEYGYVPIAWRQDWGGSVAVPGVLKFTSVPVDPTAGSTFNVTVQAMNNGGGLQNVIRDTFVQLSVASGYGTLSGNTVGTIVSGSGSVTLSGVTYSAADSMTLSASATCLSPVTSASILFTNSSGKVNLFNRPSTGVTTTAATLNGTFDCMGTNGNFQVYWGSYSGGTNPTAWANSASVGSWLNTTSTNLSRYVTGLLPDTTYYFTYRGTNASGSTWASKVLSFETLALAPVITGQPSSRVSVIASTANFTVVALRGTGYQWFKGAVPLTNGGQVSGADTATLSLAGITSNNAGTYSVVVRNVSGQVTSNTTSLTLVQGKTFTWDANGTTTNITDGGGQWVSNSWRDGAANVNWSDNNDVQIGSGGQGGTIELGEVMVNRLNFLNFSNTYTLNQGTLTVKSSLTFDSAGSGKINSVIRGAGSVVKNGSGTLTLDGIIPNTYSGGTVINNGNLVWGTVIDNISPECGFACGTGPVTLNSGGTLMLQNVKPANVLRLNGGTLMSTNGWDAVCTGPVTVNGNTTVQPSYVIKISGDVSGTGGFTKTANGTLVLAGSNSYTGATDLQTGKISWQRVGAMGPGPLIIRNGAMANLDYSGTRIIKNLTLGGVAMAVGTYGSSASPASNKNDTYFSGLGTITLAVPVDLKGLPVSTGLVLRMDATQISGSADGVQLDTWTDTSGMTNHAVRQNGSSSGFPKYVARGLNGLPVVRFNSANQNGGDYLKFNRISSIRTVFWVLKENPGLADTHFLLGDSVFNDFHRGPSPNGPLWDVNYTSKNISNGTTKLMGRSVSGTTTSLPSGSFQLVTLVTKGNVSANQICQDRIFHGSWQGDIAEILIYDRALNRDEENLVGCYLSNKYGLATTYDVLPVSTGLVLRMDASQISDTANGAQLKTWSDSSGAANDAIRQSQSSNGYPKYVASGINGLPVVRFDASYPNTGDFLKFSRISSIRTVFWVLKENGGLADTHSLLGDGSSYDFHRGASPNGPFWDGNYTSTNILNGMTKLMGRSVNGTTTSLPSGNFQLVSLATTGNVSADQICQDRGFHGSWQGDIAEILIYDRTLTSEEENQVGSYLGRKYGLATAYNALPVASGLVLRMDASKITGTADGAQLNTWLDVSGAGNNAIRQSGSSSGYPKWVASGINGQPVVRFNSPNNNTGDYLKFSRLSTIRTVFWVMKENTGLSVTHFMLGDSRGYDFHRGDTPNGPLWNSNYTSQNIRNGMTKLMGIPINGTTTSLPSGNFQLVSLVTTDNVSADQICQDRVYHGSWQGDIAEILIYDRALTIGEETKVGSYLAAKYGLVTSYTSSAMHANSVSGLMVTPEPETLVYAAWAGNSVQGLEVGINDGPMEDPDHDGINNLLEFALGGEPTVQSGAILPVLVLERGSWFFEYSRSEVARASSTQIVEYSSDLKTWSSIDIATDTSGAVEIIAGRSSERIKVAIPAEIGKPTFARLRITN